jgi:LacI family transcriptional regulator
MTAARRPPDVLLLVETSEAYGRGLMQGIIRYLEQHADWRLWFESRALTERLPPWVESWRGDGIIARSACRQDMLALLAKRVPLVELHVAPTGGARRVQPDEQVVARLAVEHFSDRGLREYFAYFSLDVTMETHWIDARLEAYEQAVAERGGRCSVFRPRPQSGTAGRDRPGVDDAEIIAWLRSLPRPCGVLAATDSHALKLVRACRQAGLAVPEDIAVLGVDNDPVFCEACSPRLSSIDLDAARVGYDAAALLAGMLAGGPPPPAITISDAHAFIETRGSTDVVALADAKVAAAARVIRDQACRQVRVDQIAKAVGLSRRMLEQRFRSALDRTPKDEIRRVQLEQAKSLLRSDAATMQDVARLSGFGSLEYFDRVFRKSVGMTPAAYRRHHRIVRAIGSEPGLGRSW